MELDQAKRMKDLEKENARLKRLVADLSLGEADPEGHFLGKLVSPERRRQAVERIRGKYGLSERQACRLVGQPRGTQRYSVLVRADETGADATKAIIALASQYGRYGYRRITSLLNDARDGRLGPTVYSEIWRCEGLKIPKKQRPRGRLWLNDGSCIRLRPERRNHVWSYDFVEASDPRWAQRSD